MNGMKLSPRPLRTIFTRYNNINHHYGVFSPDTKKTIVSADIFFPPLTTEGALPSIHCSINRIFTPLQKSQVTSIVNNYTNKGESSDSVWRKWMAEHPQEANDQFDNGHPTISRLLTPDFMDGKRDGYLWAGYWGYDDNNMVYHEALPQQLNDNE